MVIIKCKERPPSPTEPFEECIPTSILHDIEYDDGLIVGRVIIGNTDGHRHLAGRSKIEPYAHTPHDFKHGRLTVLGLCDYSDNIPRMSYSLQQERDGNFTINDVEIAKSIAALSATALIRFVSRGRLGVIVPEEYVIEIPTEEPNAHISTL